MAQQHVPLLAAMQDFGDIVDLDQKEICIAGPNLFDKIECANLTYKSFPLLDDLNDCAFGKREPLFLQSILHAFDYGRCERVGSLHCT